MIADQPITVYKHEKDRSKENNYGHTETEMNALSDAFNEENRGKSLAGKHISLAEYLSNEKKNKK